MIWACLKCCCSTRFCTAPQYCCIAYAGPKKEAVEHLHRTDLRSLSHVLSWSRRACTPLPSCRAFAVPFCWAPRVYASLLCVFVCKMGANRIESDNRIRIGTTNISSAMREEEKSREWVKAREREREINYLFWDITILSSIHSLTARAPCKGYSRIGWNLKVESTQNEKKSINFLALFPSPHHTRALTRKHTTRQGRRVSSRVQIDLLFSHTCLTPCDVSRLFSLRTRSASGSGRCPPCRVRIIPALSARQSNFANDW